MKIWELVPLILLVGGFVAVADDEKFSLLKAGNDTYTNVTVTKVTAADISFIHAGGIANVKLKDLSPELQKQFRYDPQQARVAEKKLADNKAQYHQQLIKAPAAPAPDLTRPTTTAKPGSAPKQIWATSYLGQKAPALEVEKWLTPEPKRQGKFVLIDFWATWCPPCRRAIPELNTLQHKFGDKLVVIGLSDEPEAAVRKLVNPKINYAVAIDTLGRTKANVGVTGIPHVILVDPAGIVRWEGYPLMEGHELTEQVVADVIAKYSE